MEGDPRINAINELNWVGSVFLKSHCHFDLFLQQPFCVHSWVKRIWDHFAAKIDLIPDLDKLEFTRDVV